ncbi:PilN domain-containing protein [Desulfobulbus sp. F4]|nr:PilN domain-containing protein [Desulfobulbus sp. F3]MCW5200707.1 PilN domain-containing protein [Desulfobulbus sp. F4]
MAQISAGIDIGEELLTAAIVSGTGKDAKVIACAAVPLESVDADSLAAALPPLIMQLGQEKANRCVIGLTLSCMSLRNLALPFADEKKVRQALPFELEEQLLLPLEEQIVATVSSAGRGAGVALLAAAAEKVLLRSLLESFQQSGLEPDSICPTVYVLADRICRTDHAGGMFILLHGEISAVQMVAVRNGEIVFMRRLAWPDTVFTQAVFQSDSSGISIADSSAANEAVRSLCGLVQQSLDYFALQSGTERIVPECFVLSGPLQDCPGVLNILEAGLDISGRHCDLTRDGAASLGAAVAGRWQPALHDKVLALALHQAGRRGKEAVLDFRQGELAPARRLLRSKRQIAALVGGAAFLLLACCGWFFVERRQLESSQSQLAAKMEKVFQESFPGVKAGPDPLSHMRSRRKSMAASPAALPVFSDEKRVLAILADISAKIPDSMQVQVERLVIDQNSVSIRGTTDAFNNVNSMQSLLNKSGRYAEVKIVSAAKGKQDEGILFEIRLQLRTEADA